MGLILNDLVRASDADGSRWGGPQRQNLLRLRRGVYLPQQRIAPSAQPWQVRRSVTEARILSAAATCHEGDPPVFTLECALVLHGLDPWWNTTDVVYRRSHRAPRRNVRLPTVSAYGVEICAVTDRLVTASPVTDEVVEVAGVLTPPLWAVAIDCARLLHPLSAIAAVSQIMRRYVKFDRRHLVRSRRREAEVRRRLIELLEPFRGKPLYRQARAVLEAADAGIESPGEAYLLWITHCIVHSSGTQVATQQSVQVDGRQYYGDVSLPAHRVILEFDGYGKLPNHTQRFADRHRHLVLAGWRVIHVEGRQLSDPDALTRYLIAELRKLKVEASSPSGPLWVPLHRDLMSPERRF